MPQLVEAGFPCLLVSLRHTAGCIPSHLQVMSDSNEVRPYASASSLRYTGSDESTHGSVDPIQSSPSILKDLVTEVFANLQ